ncbi:hypothetical protein XENTR_v10000423 [Xenopus tropicalis]|uniref:Superoxide dismutase [Cu-Zn] n=1 Tax=Xenopus tropicalis TaxID=8364 RepID=F6QT27_XENTR|nr:extracellular superoxide dismutase [Cu-Zn] precursor [Xenopus tropicalis]XP_012827249.1 extracellular superoxide dismutase [Cu-Zn] isoform X1 [Xenopus tropicalis]AAI55516.1 LOC100127868 protein [Xenopus tropicalis]KAE8629281.1 hypothetical protein XENTR_v10000423 [Xenopus tropicalis]|eukprot:XP_012827249.1 PREDICTED: extracellular superoxide dismutase [Cu-Zn] isoform X1 [Xenopus tropicalis]
MNNLLYLAVALTVCELLSAGAEVVKPVEEELLTDTNKKVNELWINLLNMKPTDNDGIAYATCSLSPSSKLEPSEVKVTGLVLFKQVFPSGTLEAIFDLEGFPTDANQSARAIHIHTYGDLTNGCDSAGGHYNPMSVDHPQHPGDFGNFRVRDGKIQKFFANLDATLFGPFSVIGRSVVVHKQADDLGKGNNQASLENGNAGKRLACCIIGSSSKNNWEKYAQDSAAPRNLRFSRRVKNG